MRSEKSMEFHDPSRIPGADGRDNNLPDVQGRENESGCAHAPYSVLMSVYRKEDPSHLLEALDSMVSQTVPPEEIVLVEDGRLTGPLYVAVDEFQSGHPGLLTVVSYGENLGLGHALASGLPECRNEIVARMDSDDYAFPDRMEKQLGALLGEHLDMVGSQVTEFVTAPDEPITESSLPCDSKDIEAYSKKRNPFRHPTMVFRRSRALRAGNYSGEYLYFEDWDLFNRMLADGCRACNINEPLVAMRVSPDFYARRGGPKYLPHIWRFKTAQLRRGYFAFWQFLVSTLPHVAVCLVPNGVRSFIYTKLLRKGTNR